MISVSLKGGLANQMFQIAALVNVGVENRCKFAIDPQIWPAYGGADIGDQDPQKMVFGRDFQAAAPNKYINNIFRHVPRLNLSPASDILFAGVYHEDSFTYEKIPYIPRMVLEGYFQSEKYFKDSENVIRKIFYPPPEVIQSFREQYRQNDHRLVAIHVRRGAHTHNWEHHGSLPAAYFEKAMAMFDNCRFLVFSDDMPWCKQYLHADHLEYVEGHEDYEDLYYMSLCDSNIIANSTFSWWGAWLNNNPDKTIISPRKWFGPAKKLDTKDLLPPTWVTIDNDLEGPHGIV
tara:strand:+ start:12021 stop:12890 length:870 start_codon:yes stop_codon:yes gene_type:complete